MRFDEVIAKITRRALGGAHVPPTNLFPRLAVNKTILKPRLAAATGVQYLYLGISRRNKIPHCSAYDIEKAIRFRHPDYNPERAQKLISSSMSRHLSTRHISSKSMHAFLSNLANRQTGRHTNKRGQTHLPPPLSEITSVSETIRKPPLVKAQTALKQKKYGEKRFSIWQMELLHSAMWHVALES